MSAQYKTAKGEWKNVNNIRTGASVDYLREPAFFKVAPDSQMPFVVGVTVTVESEQFDTPRRLHKSLPDPLSVRVTFEEVSGKKATLAFVCQNEPLELVDRQQLKLKKENTFWLQVCDDTNAELQLFATVGVEEKEGREGKIVKTTVTKFSSPLSLSSSFLGLYRF
jgi:hypothetical protein